MTKGPERDQLNRLSKPADPTRVPYLDKTIRRTRLAMGIERALQAFWPVWTLSFAVYAALGLDLVSLLPDWAALPAVALSAIGIVVLGVRALQAFRWPRRFEAVARLDADLPGRPIAALSDRQATGRDDAEASAVWAAHMRLVARQAARAKAAAADLRLSSRDRYGLRFAAVSILIAALLFGQGEVGEQLDAGLSTPARASMDSGPVLEAWATPPAYTGKPTLYLTDLTDEDLISMPQGTVLTLRLYGSDEPQLSQTIFTPPAGPVDFGDNDRGFHQLELRADMTGMLSVADGTETLASWSINVLPDTAPEVVLSGPPERTVSGAGKFTYEGRDDYGVVAAWATVALDLDRIERRYGFVVDPEPRDPISFDLPLPLTGMATEFTETEIIDLSTHPWADLPVTIVLHARDAAGQEVTSETYEIVLPGRRFYESHAAAIVEQRRDLLWNTENTPRVSRMLKAITHLPDDLFESPKAYLMTRTAIRRLDYARADNRVPAVRDEVSDLLWLAALLIEEGDIASALERLRRAQERLAEALREDATEEELAELMQELRQAMQEYMQELMRQALEDMEQQEQNQDQAQTEPNMSTQDLQEMLERIEELMREGRREEAEELLRQLQQMMENLQMTMRPGQPQDGQGQQMMEGLQNLMRQQQELGDETFEELQRQLGQGQPQPGQPGQQPGTDQLGQQQEALRQLLDEFRQGMPRSPGLPGQEGDPMDDARRALEDAERNMGDARDRLDEGDPGAAVDDQAEALENLREGMRNLAEAQRMAQQQTGPQDGTQANENPGQQRDPLGRPIGETGQIDGSDVEIPGSEAYKRSRELREEILRRSGEQERPRLELDYLRRLLERF